MRVTVEHEDGPTAFVIPEVSEWPEFMTIPEVAAILRISKMTVYRMVHRGDLASIRAGRSFRIYSRGPERSLENYLKNAEVSA